MALPPPLAALDLAPPVEDTPLAVLFEWLQTLHDHLDQLPTPSTHFFRAAWKRLEAANTAVDLLGLFSPNEDEDDLSTDSLRFLLLPYYAAEVLTHFAPGEAGERWHALSRVLTHYDRFLTRCSQYKLLGEVCRPAWERIEMDGTTNAEERRNEKVGRFKREKAIAIRVAQLKQLKGKEAATEKDAEEFSQASGMDEEQERMLWKLLIEAAVAKAISQKELLSQEIRVLEMMKSRANHDPMRTAAESDNGPSTFDQLKNVAVDLLKQNGRQSIREKVFQPSHILPKYTIEQQAEWEMKEAIKQKESKKMSNSSTDKDGDSDDDEELAKQRAWDDWKDDHPYGYGNSKLRPCA